ncbi:MAG TPA: hypothetical protein VGC32_14970 [Solirubrobacterales bacterium]
MDLELGAADDRRPGDLDLDAVGLERQRVAARTGVDPGLDQIALRKR